MAVLNDALQDGEVVEYQVSAQVPAVRFGSATLRTGLVAVTNHRVIFFSSKVGGFESQSIDYDLIASVDFKKGMMYGELDIAAAGDHARAKQIAKGSVEELARIIKEKVRQRRETPLATAGAQPADPADQIRKLAGLRDDGLITDEEFQSKKQQILGI